MPIILTPTTSRMVSRDEIRRWLRDTPGSAGGGVAVPGTGVLNVLLDGVEFSDEDVDAGIVASVDRYNVMTPMTSLGPDLIPRPLIMYGCVAHLLWSESFRQLRNQATVQDADVQPIGIDDKAPAYTQASQMLWKQWEEMARAVKTQRNMEGMYGSLSSGYQWVAGRWT